MYSLNYGTVPIVRATGGLDDTVQEGPEGEGTGFKFRDYTAFEMLACLDRALKAYLDRKKWKKIMTNGMAKDYSWKRSAENYVNLYESLINA
jgi:starch synthase